MSRWPTNSKGKKTRTERHTKGARERERERDRENRRGNDDDRRTRTNHSAIANGKKRQIEGTNQPREEKKKRHEMTQRINI